MRSRFFRKKPAEVTVEESNLHQFLENYPAKEVWRFFVEKIRYDYSKKMYERIYRLLNRIDQKTAINLTMSELEKYFKEISFDRHTIQDMCDLASEKNDSKFVSYVRRISKWADNKDQKIMDFIDKHQGWRGFEVIEPQYLMQVINGFCLVLRQSLKKQKLSLKFIKKLHKTCTENVKKMLTSNVPGEFRKKAAYWRFDREINTIEGLIEIFNYLKVIELDSYRSGIKIKVTTEKGKNEEFDKFRKLNSEALAKYIFELSKNENNTIHFAVTQFGTNAKFLEILCDTQVDEFNRAIKKAKSKEEKLTAIFTYLKHAVLYHPFQDGVGRTFSMLLLQHLLLNENLLPVILFDSNIIPGYSVNQLVKEYLKAEKEMKEILQNPKYISSEEFANPNISTRKLYKKLSTEEKEYFKSCVKTFKTEAKSILEKLNQSKASDYKHGKVLKV